MSKKSDSSPSLSWKIKLVCRFADVLTAAPSSTISRFLYNLIDVRTPADAKLVDGVKGKDVTVDPSRNLWFRVYTPETASQASLPVIIYFHGGGFTYCSADSRVFDLVGRMMASQTPAIVVSVNYRLAPKYRCPAPYEDGLDAIKYLDNSPTIDGLAPSADLSRCFIAGDSAGGNLAHHVVRRFYETKFEFRVLRVIGLVAIQPFFGGEERTPAEIRLAKAPLLTAQKTDKLWKLFLPEGSDRDHEAVNVTGQRAADISGLDFPATLVLVGAFDPMQDWQRRYFHWLEKSGKEAYRVELPTLHGFYYFPELPETSQLYTEVVNFVHNQLDKLK